MNKMLLVMLVVVLALGLALAGCSAPAQSAQVGEPAPEFQLPGLDGKSVSLGHLRGSPVMVNFWAIRCLPCRYEMPHIEELFQDQEWSARGLVILAIDIGESPAGVRDFLQSFGFSFPVLLDASGDVASKYGVRYIPTTFFIDKDGIIQAIKIGAFSSKVEIERSLSRIVT